MCWRSVSGGHNRRWIHIENDAVGPSNKQGHLISNEFFLGTDLLRRAPSVRREEYEAMEGLTTTSSQPSSYGVPQSKGKQLQLTPLWEHIVKNNQLPPETDKDVLFQELVLRMSDLEWEVRGHALRVLLDLIPVMELSELDRYMMPTMLQELTYNLGHSSPSVRKGALDTLGVYLTHSTDPETVLRDIVREGLESKTLNNPAKGNIALGVILGIPSLVNPLLSPKDGIVLISQTGLIHLVSALSKKLVQDTYQEQSLKTLVRIREMVGESRFDRFLEGFHPQCKKDFDILCQVYDVTSLGDSGIDLQASSQSAHGYWSESSSTRAASSSTHSPEEMQFQDQNQNYIFIDDKTSSSDSSPSPKEEEEEGVQVVQEETEQPADDESINADGYESFQAVPDEEGSAMMAAEEDGDREEHLEVLIEERAVSRMDHDDPENVEPEEEAITVIEGEPMDEGVLNSSRVILETEIKFNEDDAIMMTIMEEGEKAGEQTRVEEQEETQMPESDEGYRVYNNDYVVKVMTDDEDYDDNEDVAMADHPIRRTPRRVRFGGEMVMMRTPDSEDGREGQAIDQEESNADQEADIEGDETITTDTGEIVAIEDARQDSVENARRDSLVNIQEDDTLDEALQPEYTAEDEARQDLIDYLNEEEAPEDVQHVGMENTRRDSFRRQDTIIENSSRQNSVEDSRQNSVQDSGQNSVQEYRQNSVQDSGQNSVQESRQNSVQESRQNSVQDSRQNSVQDSRQNSQENGRRSSIADSRQDSLENSRRASIQDIRQDSLETSRNNFVSDSRQNSVEKGRRASIEDSRQNSLENNNRRSSIQEVRQDSVESRRDSMQSNRQSSLESRRGSVQAESIIEVPEETIQVLRSDSVEDDSRPAIQVVLEDDEQQAIQVIPDDDPDQNMPALQSHIPLPVAPAKSIPRDHRKRGSLYKKRLQRGSQGSGSQEQSVDSKGSSVSGSEGDAPDDNPTPAPAPVPIPAGDNAGDSSDGKEDVNPEEEDPEDLGPDWEDFGIVPNRVVEDMQDQEEWVSRIHGIESLSNALKDPDVLHSLMPCLPSLLHTLLVTMADDKNYRVATCSIGAVRSLINSLPFTIIQENLSQIIKGLTRHIGGAGSVNLKIETAAVAKTLMLMMKPNPVVEILLTPDCIGAKSSKLRENSLLFLIYATLMFPSTEFHWDRMTEKVASAVADPRRRVRLAALDALSVIAQFTTPSLLDEAVKTTADKQPNFATRVAYLAGVQARLARRQLPTTSQDGLILYVLQIPSARTSGKGVFSASPIGMFGPCPSLGRQPTRRGVLSLCDKRQLKALEAMTSTECIRLHHQLPRLKLNQQLPPLKLRTLRSDVDWVLSGSGSLSSGSAKSRAQLIAAQRIDPQAGNFPEELQAVTIRNKWTERKGTVAAGVQSRVQSASLAPIHSATPKKDEPRSRTSVTTWTTDLDVNNIKASQSPKRSQIVRAGVLSPPDVANLGNHSVLKGSFSLLPNRLTQSTLISEGVGQEQLNQTWPPPTSGRHSPRIPKSSSKKRGRRILEPLNGPGSPFQGVSPMIMPRGKSPGTKAPSRGTSPRPRGTSSMSRGVSPVARSPSPMPIRSTSSGRHKIPPLSPRKKKEPVEASAFVNLPSFKDDEIIDLASLRRARRRKRSTNRGKGIIAIEHEPPQADEEQHVELRVIPTESLSSEEQFQQNPELLEVPSGMQE